jgi:hypothetical protein
MVGSPPPPPEDDDGVVRAAAECEEEGGSLNTRPLSVVSGHASKSFRIDGQNEEAKQ